MYFIRWTTSQGVSDEWIHFNLNLNFPMSTSLFVYKDAEETVIPADNKSAIKSAIVDLMITVSPIIQLQLSEAVSIIADHDFPQKWDTLIQVNMSKREVST